jgi:predicted outer membrane repeat protein
MKGNRILSMFVALCLVFTMFAAMPLTASATTYTVITTDNSGQGSLRDALAAAGDGDTIEIQPELGTINLTSGHLEIPAGKTITINGNGATIDGGGITSPTGGGILYVANTANVTITDLTFANGKGDKFGGAIYNDGTLALVDTTFTNNEATQDGGAIENCGVLNISGNTSFTGNEALSQFGVGGAIDNWYGSVNISGSVYFSGNTANSGGAIYCYGGLTNNGTITNDDTIFIVSGRMLINNGTFYTTGTIANNGFWVGALPVYTSTLTLSTSASASSMGYSWVPDGANGGKLTLTNFVLETSDDYGISFASDVTGAVEIELVGASSVTGYYHGIEAVIASSLTMTISGNGTLSTTGGYYGIYILGDITISGGTVIATSNSWGIYAGGDITISGGTVTATSDYFGIYALGNIEINGDAVVKANGDNSQDAIVAIGDVDIVKGVVFEDGVGTVYGNVTLPGDLTVENGETLTVPSGSSLTVPSGTSLTNSGTITNNGTINNNGAIAGSGTITGSGTIVVPTVKVSKVTITNSASVYTYKAADAVHTMQHAVSILPANATVKKVTWKSSNNQLATVNATGLVTFTGKEGTVRITATSPDGPSHYKDIKVVKNVTKLRTPLTARNLTVKKKISVKPVIDDGNKIITAGLTYKSSNPKVATVDAKGNVKGIKKGKATITIRSQNGKKATVKINVAKKAVKLKKFTLTGVKKNALTLQKGKTKDLKIKLAQSKASDLKVTFKSSKSSVAKVDAAGRITAVKKGTATITVKAGSKTVKVKVTVE